MRALVLLATLLLAAPAKHAKPSVPSAAGWTVQVASTSSRDEAERLVTLLVGKDEPAWWSETTVNGKTMYRVRVGHFRRKDDARTFGDAIANELKLQYWVAPDDRPERPAAAPVPTVSASASSPIPTPTPETAGPHPSATPPATIAGATPRATGTETEAATATQTATATPATESAEAILARAQAAHGGANGGFGVLDRAASVRLKYRLRSVDPKTGDPVFTEQVYLRKGKDRLRLEVSPLEGTGPSSVTVYTTAAAWVRANGTTTALTPPTARARIESLGPAGILRLPLEFPRKGTEAANFVTAVNAGRRTLNGEEVVRLDAAPPPPSYREASLYVDPASSQLAAARFLTDAGELLLTFGGYRDVAAGLLVPFQRTVYRDGTVVSSIEIDELSLDVPLDDALFRK